MGEPFPSISELVQIFSRAGVKYIEVDALQSWMVEYLEDLLQVCDQVAALMEKEYLSKEVVERSLYYFRSLRGRSFELSGDFSQTLKMIKYSRTVEPSAEWLIREYLGQVVSWISQAFRGDSLDLETISQYRIVYQNKLCTEAQSKIYQSTPLVLRELPNYQFDAAGWKLVRRFLAECLRTVWLVTGQMLQDRKYFQDTDVVLRLVIRAIFPKEAFREIVHFYQPLIQYREDTELVKSMNREIQELDFPKYVSAKLMDETAIYFYHNLIFFLVKRMYQAGLPENVVEAQLIERLGEYEVVQAWTHPFFAQLLRRMGR